MRTGPFRTNKDLLFGIRQSLQREEHTKIAQKQEDWHIGGMRRRRQPSNKLDSY